MEILNEFNKNSLIKFFFAFVPVKIDTKDIGLK